MRHVIALALLAAALWVWPRAVAVIRLERALCVVEPGDSTSRTAAWWGIPRWPRSPPLRGLFGAGVVAGLAQVWPLPVAAVLVAVAATAGTGLVRGRRQRVAVGEEKAAVEGLGVLVAELRAGRAADEALAAAGRHCDHPKVGALLARLGRSLRLGDRLAGWLDGDERAPPPEWQVRLITGVRLSQRTGCALADVVAAVESDLARRARQRADVRASAAGHRATVALLAGLPILGLAMGSGIGAEPVRILTTTSIGQILLMVGVALELAGLAWSRRMTGAALREG